MTYDNEVKLAAIDASNASGSARGSRIRRAVLRVRKLEWNAKLPYLGNDA